MSPSSCAWRNTDSVASIHAPKVVLNSEAKYTWPLGIMQFQGQYGSDWPRILAFLTLSILPAIAFFLLAQRYVISGLTGGAVKG